MNRLKQFLIAGVVAYGVGVVVMVMAWPSMTGSGFYQETDGNLFWAFVGGVSASVGAGLSLVALIGYGVKYGREAAEVN